MKELKDKIPSINMLLLAFEEWRVKKLAILAGGELITISLLKTKHYQMEGFIGGGADSNLGHHQALPIDGLKYYQTPWIKILNHKIEKYQENLKGVDKALSFP